MTMWHIVAYLAGFATLPAMVLVMLAWERVGGGGWTTHLLACSHGGPNTSRNRAPGGWDEPVVSSRWTLRWRCDVIVGLPVDPDADPELCRGLWVRGWVARLLPARLLWPVATARARKRERIAAEYERVASIAQARDGKTAAVTSLRRLAAETREGRHDGSADGG